MLAALLQFLLAASAIIVAGTYLSRFADDLAELTGLGRMVVGSVLLAGTTSLPELTVALSAIRLGAADLAVGDLLGASLMNLLILAVLDLSSRSRGKMLSPQSAAHALSGGVSGVLTLLVALGLLVGPAWKGLALGGVSAGLWLVVLGYGLGARLVYLDQRISLRTAHEQALPTGPAARSLRSAAFGFAVRGCDFHRRSVAGGGGRSAGRAVWPGRNVCGHHAGGAEHHAS